ncbi:MULTISPECIES: PAAR domain-containing protein [Streptomyces]|uniref:PaaR repeat-containing protein n=2 Tax=Streptomyces TaxID=1883 RepID=A0A101Q3V6_STRCK|nr:PAAR domain-containing protein [Streptomyces corchorusii]ALO92081.1 PAAR repeat-containing protein [Streptomyces hygroscopicus subsp. limoneus]KUN22748.1 PaaR repeat-containing protein [Streptomyces corchorusii]
MPAAARVGDPTGHPGVIGPPGEPTVLIGGRPAATVGTAHQCSSPAAHAPSALAPPGSSTVLIGGRPAVRVGDAAGCGSPVTSGCPSVQIGG